jgi:translation initiation factor 2 beta subunit (eIF-2beta)/eIF-5
MNKMWKPGEDPKGLCGEAAQIEWEEKMAKQEIISPERFKTTAKILTEELDELNYAFEEMRLFYSAELGTELSYEDLDAIAAGRLKREHIKKRIQRRQK